MNLPEILTAAQRFYEATELGRILGTATVIGIGVFLSKAWTLKLRKQAEEDAKNRITLDVARQRFVQAKNLIWVTVVLIVFTIWASKIAGLILSLAAVAGAALIVSKEIIMCLLGYMYITGSRTFNIGDFIDVNGQKGKVVDIDILATTLAETSTANQQTGRTLTLPNSVWLSHPVRNFNATGEHIVNTFQLMLPVEADVDMAEEEAIAAATVVAGRWVCEVNNYLAKHEMRKLVDVPSARPKVLWIPLDAKTHAMVIRYGCPINERVTSEQAIFRQFWRNYNRRLARAAEKPNLAEEGAVSNSDAGRKPAEVVTTAGVQD